MRYLSILTAVIFMSLIALPLDAQNQNMGMMGGGMMMGPAMGHGNNGMMMNGRHHRGMMNNGRMMQNKGTMMGSGMMMGGGMMLVMQPMLTVISELPDMQKALSLTNDQVTSLNNMSDVFLKYAIDKRGEIQKLIVDINRKTRNNANDEEIRGLMDRLSNAKTDFFMTTYDTATNMKKVLTKEQMTKFNDL